MDRVLDLGELLVSVGLALNAVAACIYFFSKLYATTARAGLLTGLVIAFVGASLLIGGGVWNAAVPVVAAYALTIGSLCARRP
jgi:hypothetical protein